MREKQYLEALLRDTDHLIAYFGHARLVRTPAGRLEVRGGTDADHADAWDWVRRVQGNRTPPSGTHVYAA